MTAFEMTNEKSFRLDRRIPVALVAAFVLQTGGALFWAGSAAQRIAEVVSLINSTVISVKTMIAEARDPTAAEWNALYAQIAALSPGQPSPFPQYPAS